MFHKPLLGVANQHLYLPLWALTRSGVSFEWFLQRSGADAVLGTVNGAVSGSTAWTISNVKLHMDVLHVDEALMVSCSAHILQGSSLVVLYRLYSNLSFTHAGSSTAKLQVPRTFSRVNHIWVMPSGPGGETSFQGCELLPGPDVCGHPQVVDPNRVHEVPIDHLRARHCRSLDPLPKGVVIPLERLPPQREHSHKLRPRFADQGA